MKYSNLFIFLGVVVIFGIVFGIESLFTSHTTTSSPTTTQVVATSVATTTPDVALEASSSVVTLVPEAVATPVVKKVTVAKKVVPKNTTTTPSSGTFIKIGQKMLLNGVFVTPLKTAYDSRCPKDVRCIQAGTFDLGVLLESGTLSQNLIITLGKPFVFGNKKVTLVAISPLRTSGKTIGEADYRFNITVK